MERRVNRKRRKMWGQRKACFFFKRRILQFCSLICVIWYQTQNAYSGDKIVAVPKSLSRQGEIGPPPKRRGWPQKGHTAQSP